MFAKKYRLTKNKEFEKIFQNSNTFFTKSLGIRYIKNNLDITRFGILVSKKISKKAVVRNKIKRRIREVLRQKMEKIKPGYDIVILTRPEILELDYSDIEKNIEYGFKKTKLLIH